MGDFSQWFRQEVALTRRVMGVAMVSSWVQERVYSKVELGISDIRLWSYLISNM